MGNECRGSRSNDILVYLGSYAQMRRVSFMIGLVVIETDQHFLARFNCEL
jgi:hypothetical protein